VKTESAYGREDFTNRSDSLLMLKPLEILKAEADGLASGKPGESKLELADVPRKRY